MLMDRHTHQLKKGSGVNESFISIRLIKIGSDKLLTRTLANKILADAWSIKFSATTE